MITRESLVHLQNMFTGCSTSLWAFFLQLLYHISFHCNGQHNIFSRWQFVECQSHLHVLVLSSVGSHQWNVRAIFMYLCYLHSHLWNVRVTFMCLCYLQLIVICGMLESSSCACAIFSRSSFVKGQSHLHVLVLSSADSHLWNVIHMLDILSRWSFVECQSHLHALVLSSEDSHLQNVKSHFYVLVLSSVDSHLWNVSVISMYLYYLQQIVICGMLESSSCGYLQQMVICGMLE